MKINSINLASNFHKQASTNFKGLWGKESIENLSQSYYDAAQNIEVGDKHSKTTKEYHPFADETDFEIKKIRPAVKSNNRWCGY